MEAISASAFTKVSEVKGERTVGSLRAVAHHAEHEAIETLKLAKVARALGAELEALRWPENIAEEGAFFFGVRKKRGRGERWSHR
jgi:hypothetical protein